MPKHKEPDPEFTNFEQRERIIDAFKGLEMAIDDMRHVREKDYSQLLAGLRASLDDLGDGLTHEGCLKRIHRELHLLNKTLKHHHINQLL